MSEKEFVAALGAGVVLALLVVALKIAGVGEPETCEERGGRIEQVDCRKRFECTSTQHAWLSCSRVERCDEKCMGAK